MIDTQQFALVMGSFADRIGKPLQSFTARMYYDALSAELTTEEFVAGARIVFKDHKFNTWPAPAQFIEAVKPQDDPALEGAEFFDLICGRVNPERIAASLGPVVMRAFAAAGGRREFTAVLEADVQWLRKRFVESYVEAKTVNTATTVAHVALANVDPKAAALIASTAKTLGTIDHKRLAAGERDDA